MESDTDPRSTSPGASKARRRIATVYDAVAGKVTYQPLRDTASDTSHPRNEAARVSQYNLGEVPFAPEEVLFRRKDAPQRYMEHDIYFANEQCLPRGGQGVLPSGDLLEAIHAYTSKFYAASAGEGEGRELTDERTLDERSMDETALIALGFLLTEAGKEVLGRRGDCVFTEGKGASQWPDNESNAETVFQSLDSPIPNESRSTWRKKRKVSSTNEA